MLLCAYYAIRSERHIAHLSTRTFLAEYPTGRTSTTSPSQIRSSRTSGPPRLLFRYDLVLMHIYTPTAKQYVSTSYNRQDIGGSGAPISPPHTPHSPVAAPSSLRTAQPTALRSIHACTDLIEVILREHRPTHSAARATTRRLHPTPLTHTRKRRHAQLNNHDQHTRRTKRIFGACYQSHSSAPFIVRDRPACGRKDRPPEPCNM